MGGICSMSRGDEKCIQYFGCKNLDHSDDLDLDGKIILELILGKQGGKVWYWIHLAQDKDK
jgi:hypothetical protein